MSSKGMKSTREEERNVAVLPCCRVPNLCGTQSSFLNGVFFHYWLVQNCTFVASCVLPYLMHHGLRLSQNLSFSPVFDLTHLVLHLLFRLRHHASWVFALPKSIGVPFVGCLPFQVLRALAHGSPLWTETRFRYIHPSIDSVWEWTFPQCSHGTRALVLEHAFIVIFCLCRCSDEVGSFCLC